MRKLCTLELLSGTKIESMKSMRKEVAENFVTWATDAADEAGMIFDLSEKVGSLTEEMTYRMIFGGKCDTMDFKSCTHEFVRLLGAFNIADYVPFVGPLDLQGIRRSMKATSKVVDRLLENIINERVQNAARANGNYHQGKDFLDVMLSLAESDTEYQLDRASMKAIILDMIVGGIDTSSVTIDWTLSELFRHPEIMKRVQSELEKVVGMDRMVEESDLEKLQYLDLVVKEAMRLHPVVPLITPHLAREEITINGYHIPKHFRILVNAWAIGHDPNTWSTNVEEFCPERFYGLNNVDFRGNDFRFLPFGSGRRGCPGVQLGLLMVLIILAQLLHCFNLELPDGISPHELGMTEKPGLATPRANPLLAISTFRIHL